MTNTAPKLFVYIVPRLEIRFFSSSHDILCVLTTTLSYTGYTNSQQTKPVATTRSDSVIDSKTFKVAMTMVR